MPPGSSTHLLPSGVPIRYDGLMGPKPTELPRPKWVFPLRAWRLWQGLAALPFFAAAAVLVAAHPDYLPHVLAALLAIGIALEIARGHAPELRADAAAVTG